jgi:co-chaperonin GroES (HSP10)
MAINLNTINGTLKPINDRVLVSNMYFGEQKLKSGLIISDDNGSTRGIYPRWGQVHAKGPNNDSAYQIGDWVLVEHGRWTRSVKIDEGTGELELRMVDAECILAYDSKKPDDVQIGKSYNDGDHATIAPEAFGAGA